MELLRSLSYVVPGSLIAGVALHAAVSLSAAFTVLRAKAAEQQRGVPPLAAAYFKNTVRVLFGSAVLFFALAGTDAAVGLAAPDPMLARVFGYGSGLALLVCSFAVLLQGGVDRHLKLLPRPLRLMHPPAGGFGMCVAAWGMVLVTLHGGVWA